MPSISSAPPVLVTGGGIGGLCAALALHRAGVASRVVMKENDFCEGSVGAVGIWGRAVRILDRLGLGSRFRTIAMLTTSGEICSSTDGRKLCSLFSKTEGAAGDLWVVSRSLLRQCIFEALPPHTVSFSTKLLGYETNPFTNKVNAEIEARQWHHGGDENYTEVSTVETGLLLGADGANSFVRKEMTEVTAMRAKYSGCARWQCVVNNEDIDTFPLNSGREIWGSGKRFGTLRMSPYQVYWWAIANAARSEIAEKPFNRELAQRFQTFPFQCADLIEESDGISRHDALDWPLDFSWVHQSGKVALLGDAAHPGPPNFHSGCCLAIEDAYSLAQNCMMHGLTSRALFEYQGERRPSALQAILHGRARWRIAQLEHPVACWLRDELVKYTGIGRGKRLLAGPWEN